MRVDGRRVKGINAMYALVPQFLTRRYDAMNMITLDIPSEPMRHYMNEKRREGIHISHLALIIAAYLRTAAEFPHINRFIGNHGNLTADQGKDQHFANEVCIAFVFGMNRNGRIAKECFGASCSYRYIFIRFALNGVANVPE